MNADCHSFAFATRHGAAQRVDEAENATCPVQPATTGLQWGSEQMPVTGLQNPRVHLWKVSGAVATPAQAQAE